MDVEVRPTPGRSFPWRRTSAWILAVLAGLGVTASTIAVWTHRTVLETDPFMAAVQPAVESEAVQQLVSDRVGDELIAVLDIEMRVSSVLGSAEAQLASTLAEALDLSEAVVERLIRAGLGLEGLASSIAGGVEARIRGVIDDFVSSPEGTELLLRLIEETHERTVLLLRDETESLPTITVAEGEVRLNLVPFMAEALRRAVNAGVELVGVDRQIPSFETAEDADAAIDRLAILLGRDLPPGFGQVRLTTEDRLREAQNLVAAFDRAVWLLVGVTILIAIAAVLLAPSLAAGLGRVGAAALLGAALGWAGVELLTAGIGEGATTPAGEAAIGDVVDAVVSTVRGTAIALGIVGLAVAITGSLLGRAEAREDG